MVGAKKCASQSEEGTNVTVALTLIFQVRMDVVMVNLLLQLNTINEYYYK